MIAALLLASTTQLFRSDVKFDVESAVAGGSPAVIAQSRWSATTGPKGERRILWTYEGAGGESTWRREWTYDEKGDLTFQAYDVGFGDMKSRWILTREKAGWSLSGSGATQTPPKGMRLSDPSVHWFAGKTPKVGQQVGISIFDSGTLSARPGGARYARTERLEINGKQELVHVIEKDFGSTSEVHYVLPNGSPVQINQVLGKGGGNVVFKMRPLESS